MNKYARAATLGVLLILLAAVAYYYTWNWVRQGRESNSEGERESTWRVEMGKALSAHADGQNAAAEEILEKLLSTTETWWPAGPHLVETLSWLGTIDRKDQKYDLAKPLLQRAIDLGEQQGAASTTAVGRAKLNLGIIARDEPDHVEAQKLFSEAFEILSKDPTGAWGDDDAALLNLGFLANEEGNYQEGVSYLTRAVSGYETRSAKNLQSDLACTHFHLANAYRHLENYKDAIDEYQAALNIYQQLEGPNGRDVRNSLAGLAAAQQGHGSTPQARESLERSLSASKNLGDVDGATLTNLANLASDRKQYADAEKLYQRACQAYEKSGGPNDAGLANALADLGDLYRDKPQFDIRKAEPILKRALAIREKVLGAEHPETAETLSDLSLLYFYEKNFAAAIEFARRALPLEEKAFGAESLRVSTTLNRLGIAERDLGKLTEAEADLKHALAIREEKHAPKSWIAISLENLACVYSMKGQSQQANTLIARAQALRSSSSN